MFISTAPARAQVNDFHQVLSFGKGFPRYVNWNPAGDRIYVSSRTGLWIYDAETLQVVDHVDTEVQYFAFTPDGRWINPQDIRADEIFQPQTYEKVRVPGGFRKVQFSPDGKNLVGIQDDKLYRIDPMTFETDLLTVESIDFDVSVKWSPNAEKLILLHQDGALQIIDAIDGHLLLELEAYPVNIGEIKDVNVWWTPDSSKIIRFSLANLMDVSLTVHDAAAGELLVSRINYSRFDIVQWTTGENQLLITNSGCDEATLLCSIQVKIVYDQKKPPQLPEYTVYEPVPQITINDLTAKPISLGWSSNGMFLAAAVDNQVMVWAIDSRQKSYSLVWQQKFDQPLSQDRQQLRWSPADDKLIVCMDRDESQIVDVVTGNIVLTTPVAECPYWMNTQSVVNLRTPSDNYSSSSIKRWDLETGGMSQFPSTQLVWSADGNQYVDLSGGNITLWSR